MTRQRDVHLDSVVIERPASPHVVGAALLAAIRGQLSDASVPTDRGALASAAEAAAERIAAAVAQERAGHDRAQR